MSKDGRDQFGNPMAYRQRIQVTEWRWQCSLCGQIMPRAKQPPKRCSNRVRCGKPLHDQPQPTSKGRK
jgi:rRNA maturation endonuclease Nob1